MNRLLEWQKQGLEPSTLDVIQALLRLAPDDRKTASVAAHKLTSPLGDVVRFALGGSLDESAALATTQPALWIAALRGRDPSLSLSNRMTELDGPDVWTPVSREWHAVGRPDSLPEKADWPLKIKVAVKPGFLTNAFRCERPTLQLNYDPREDEDWIARELRRLKQQMPMAEQLGEVARLSPLHNHVCSRIVQTMFNEAASLPDGLLPNDAHHLLAPLHEWLVELNEPLREATRGVLAKVTGSSKTAKLAKGLLARTSPADPAQWRQIVLASLRGRLPRARLCQL
ncbi:MAG: hypothetical protein ACKV2Q_06125 [Planctomycetaceae bacterium]